MRIYSELISNIGLFMIPSMSNKRHINNSIDSIALTWKQQESPFKLEHTTTPCPGKVKNDRSKVERERENNISYCRVSF